MFLTKEELEKLNFKSIGENVLISDKASFYNTESMIIGNNVRIDDYSILSGNIEIGNYVHISAFCALYGKFGIKIGDFCGLSTRTTLFSACDDFSGEFMISPMVPNGFTKLTTGKIELQNFVQIGANSIIMPKVTCKEGSVSGTFSFVKDDLAEWSINAGIPARKIKDRSKNIKQLAKRIK